MGSTAIGQLLSFLDTITWHRSDVQLSDIRKAVAKHILQKANKGIVNGAQVSRIVAAYVVEGGQAGECQATASTFGFVLLTQDIIARDFIWC